MGGFRPVLAGGDQQLCRNPFNIPRDIVDFVRVRPSVPRRIVDRASRVSWGEVSCLVVGDFSAARLCCHF
jgi:hypothetical protein